jgi:hypothetical protein
VTTTVVPRLQLQHRRMKPRGRSFAARPTHRQLRNHQQLRRETEEREQEREQLEHGQVVARKKKDAEFDECRA